MLSNRSIFSQLLYVLIFAQFPLLIVSSLPIYNPLTGCHDLTSPNEDFNFAICLQRASNKQHPYNFYTAPSFCLQNYPPYGQLIDLSSLSLSTIDFLFESLTNLFKTRDSHISLPAPNFLWIGSNFTQNETTKDIWCSNQCQGNNQSANFLILKLRCQLGNISKSCITTKKTHWDRAPFICQSNQTIILEEQIKPAALTISPSYSNDTIVFYDSNSCVIVRTRTHQYTFCFRRQSCPQTLTSAFCTTKPLAAQICQEEKNSSNLLTIENDEEYELISKVISDYSDETLLNENGLMKNKYVSRAQWMWIDGIKGFYDDYQWAINENSLTPIPDKFWCDQMNNCSGEKGREHVVLNIVCQLNKTTFQPCLASRRDSEPGPFICKRILTENEIPIVNYTFLKNSTKRSIPVVPVYEKNSTYMYYDEHHCLTVQTHSHLYSFCLRRQNCSEKRAYCTKWSEAQKDCRSMKNRAQLLTIENEYERMLITDIMKTYLNETRLAFNGSSYRFYEQADFVWIDGIQQADEQIYLWGNERESIPEHLWCPKDQCNSSRRDRVTINIVCNKNNSLACLGTRVEWQPAPYICKRIRPKDQCPIVFNQLEYNQESEMLIIEVNRTVIFIKCKHPDYNEQTKVEYQCDSQKNEWKLFYKNENFTCPEYEPPPMAMVINTTQSITESTTQSTVESTIQSTIQDTSSTSTRWTYTISRITSTSSLQIADCSQMELSILIANLPTESRYIQTQRLPSYSSLYYNIKLTCNFNQSIQIIYRCDLINKRWMYIYGNTNQFQKCSQPCNSRERMELLNKYFTQHEQNKIQTIYLRRRNQLRLRCFNKKENQWKTIFYTCETMSITTYEWFDIHSCFQSFVSTTELPPFMVSMAITELPRVCPAAVRRGSPCEHVPGQYIFDINGCTRKVCPSLSQLCNTIRCPSDRICRVVSCKECAHTEYLQPVCEYPPGMYFLLKICFTCFFIVYLDLYA
ncbi:hypothetical protein I4U23_020461 [Adineta vaga]|nr:hypothetical protein I4U23_020461 [Adineta vaga]